MYSPSPVPPSRLRLEPLEERETPAALETAAAGAFGLFPRVVGINPDLTVRFTSPVAPGYTSVRVATGDVNGDGVEDAIATSGPGGSSWVVEYDGRTGAVMNAFFALSPALTLGLNVASADVDGDGRAEVIVGTAIGTSFVAVLDGMTGQVKQSFFALPAFFTGGVTVAAGDVSGDGRPDIIVGTASGASAVGVFDAQSGVPFRAFYVPGAPPVGVNVGYLNGDILTGRATGFPFVETFTPTGQLRLAFLAAPTALAPGGVRVAGAGGFILTDVGPSLITFDPLTGAQVRARFLFDPLVAPVYVG